MSTNLRGPLNQQWIIVKDISLNIEQDTGDWFIVSDDIFLVYGDGPSLPKAWEDYRISLAEYCEMVRADAPRRSENMQQYAYLLTYVRPVV